MWTPEALAELERLFNLGLKVNDIATRLGIVHGTVSKKITELGLDDGQKSGGIRYISIGWEAPLERRGGCLFIEGDPIRIMKAGGDPYCRAPIVTGDRRPYCARHLERVQGKPGGPLGWAGM
ncbi:MAG TPA: hypothetical protein VKU84_16925 [Stellaceae bacterium]|nr:hypothetical protein [Stellaceae bacterium]